MMVRATLARLGSFFMTLLALLSPATAGDRALAEFMGFSTDSRYFAFEEYGVQDGSGSAYSSIYIIDLKMDAWAPGSPYRAQARDEDRTLVEIRAETRKAAAAQLAILNISVPVQIMALLGDGVQAAAGDTMRFGMPAYGAAGATTGAYVVTLESFPAEPASLCVDLIGKKGLGYALSASSDGVKREVHRDATLPKSRGCPLAYRLYAVVVPFENGDLANAVALISSYPFGFEGSDRRFIAVPLGEKE